MPELYKPKSKPYPLSALHQSGQYVRVRCRYCKRTHNYHPLDLIQLFGDVDVDSLMERITCEGCTVSLIDVSGFLPTGSEAVGLKLRRLVAIRIRREPVWREG